MERKEESLDNYQFGLIGPDYSHVVGSPSKVEIKYEPFSNLQPEEDKFDPDSVSLNTKVSQSSMTSVADVDLGLDNGNTIKSEPTFIYTNDEIHDLANHGMSRVDESFSHNKSECSSPIEPLPAHQHADPTSVLWTFDGFNYKLPIPPKEVPYKYDFVSGGSSTFQHSQVGDLLNPPIDTTSYPVEEDPSSAPQPSDIPYDLSVYEGLNYEMPYKCEWNDCRASFKSLFNLTKHKEIHTGEKPYKCDWSGCQSSFNTLSHLNSHKRIHTGERPYKCDWSGCQSAFTASSYLSSHKRTHTGEKPYKCDWGACQAAFTMSSSLRRHKRIHTGERPYKCDWSGCQSAFTTSSYLASHKRTHTGEKPYKCDWSGCQSAFTTSSYLASHKRTHTGEKPYKCKWSGCQAAFSRSFSLRKHNQRHLQDKT